MAQTAGSPWYHEVVVPPETLQPVDARWTDTSQTALDWSTALTAADARAVASGSFVLIPAGTFPVTNTVVIASPVRFEPNAVLNISSGKTVTFSAAVFAPPTRIFTGAGTATLSGTGQVSLGVWTGATGLAADYLFATLQQAQGTAAATFATAASQAFFVFPNDGHTYQVKAVTLRYTTAGAASSTVDLILDTSTTAPGAGTTQLTAAIDITTTANTAVNGTIIASPTASAAGSVLSAKFNQAPTGLVGFVMTVALQRLS